MKQKKKKLLYYARGIYLIIITALRNLTNPKRTTLDYHLPDPNPKTINWAISPKKVNLSSCIQNVFVKFLLQQNGLGLTLGYQYILVKLWIYGHL